MGSHAIPEISTGLFARLTRAGLQAGPRIAGVFPGSHILPLQSYRTDKNVPFVPADRQRILLSGNPSPLCPALNRLIHSRHARSPHQSASGLRQHG